jgi:hypothetical protein
MWRIITRIRVSHCLLPLMPWMFYPAWSRGDSSLSADQIVQRSVTANNLDWKAAPNYAFTESDTIGKAGRTTRKKYQVLMIGGSPYRRLIAINAEPLPAAQARDEERKLQQEIGRRRNEGPGARRKRIAKYAQERRQDHELMREMTRAFDYKLLGNEMMNGHKCYAIEAA